MEILRRETDYALRALTALAGGRMLSTRQLSEECEVTLDHIRKIMPRLAKAGLVESARGAAGGFRIGRDASEIRLSDVIDTIQGPLVLNACVLGTEVCSHQPRCPMACKTNLLQAEINRLTEETTLADLMSA